ncbi:uncharacterized protein [Notothenia coriiceps]|uniref:Uncharacterized protein LOC104965052 n=1 Tax=Notothenia coriiceps TaxID=8208 RepID=A0A6I9PVY1_9TELE|nr:PREDICTED: uncharacterized protein LOC104965052 [Notothenia coriiceps]XP_010792297.1 PREDICTED: uncharacterized protein LOC104965052 [Notothenia coriiceps]
MLDKFKESFLLQVLTLVLLGPACEASSLGLTVHVEPLESDGGNTVRAHFTAIVPNPCPALSGLCSDGEEDCLVYPTSLPFTGTKPNSGWCVRQWQKTVLSDYNATIDLGSNTQFYVSIKASPVIRANNGKLNQPAFVALPPPLRARVNCPQHFSLSVKDLDTDRVSCRFARADLGECVSCTEHSFIELDKRKCKLKFTGKAAAGQYFIYLMAEDRIAIPKISEVIENKPLSAVPVHLSLTVEEWASSCSDVPVATGDTPNKDSILFVLPYQQVNFTTDFTSKLESVSEIAVVGPPELFRVGFKSVGSVATMNMAWVRSENKLARLLPICFAVNTKSFQSEPRCVWLYQREMRTLPAGTELTCEDTEMTLVLPLDSLSEINLEELQLNSPTCPVSYNSTHLTARISLSGCGTETLHAGSELVYTNTLQSVRPYTMVSRIPSLILPLACRIPKKVNVTGPNYDMGTPTDEEVFGQIRVWIELHLPGEGPLSKFTRLPRFRNLRMSPGRLRREAEYPSERNSNSTSTSSIDNSTSNDDGSSTSTSTRNMGSRISILDLHVLSNCSISRAEMLVSSCSESETEDFATSNPILEQGCKSSSSTLEIVTSQTNSRVYRLDLSTLEAQGTLMYIQCTVNLCIATMPSEECPDLCSRSFNSRSVVRSLFTKSYTVKSSPISLVVTTIAPTTTNVKGPTNTKKTTTTTTTATVTTTTCSHAPEQASALAAGIILTTMSIFLQNIFLY